MVSGPFVQALVWLDQLGLRDVLLPFALIFAVVYTILHKTQIFTEKVGNDTKPNKRINLIISLAIALMVVIPHAVGGIYSQDADPVNVLNTLLPGTMAIVVAAFVFLLLTGLVGGKKEAKQSTVLAIIATLAIIAFIGMVIKSVAPQWIPWFDFLSDPTIQSLIIMLGVAGVVVYYVQKDKPGTESWKDILKGLYD